MNLWPGRRPPPSLEVSSIPTKEPDLQQTGGSGCECCFKLQQNIKNFDLN